MQHFRTDSKFRLEFRIHGHRHSQTVKTSNPLEARATLARLEDNLRRMQLGTLAAPDGADLAAFLWTARRRQPMPAGTPMPSLRDAARWVGRLGGHLNRKGDEMPGVRTLWRGLRARTRLVEGYRLAHMTIP